MMILRSMMWLGGVLSLITVAANAQQPGRIDLTRTPVAVKDERPLLAPDAATCTYGFFCRQELKGDKALPVPVRFRLGSMQQNDWLERKPNVQAPAR